MRHSARPGSSSCGDRVCGPQRLPLDIGERGERRAVPRRLPGSSAPRRGSAVFISARRCIGRAGCGSTLGVDDPVEVAPDLREGVLRGLAIEVAELVDGTALDAGLGPHWSNRLAQPRMPTDDADRWGRHAASDQIIDHSLDRKDGRTTSCAWLLTPPSMTDASQAYRATGSRVAKLN